MTYTYEETGKISMETAKVSVVTLEDSGYVDARQKLLSCIFCGIEEAVKNPDTQI